MIQMKNGAFNMTGDLPETISDSIMVIRGIYDGFYNIAGKEGADKILALMGKVALMRKSAGGGQRYREKKNFC